MKSFGIFFLSVVFLVTTSGCSRHKSPPASPQCAGIPLPQEDRRIIREEGALPIHRTYQLHRIFDCQGRVQSEEWRTQTEPKNTYILEGQFRRQETVRKAFNVTTCSWGTFKEDDSSRRGDRTKPAMSIKMHTSPGTQRMQIDRNATNEIQFAFEACRQRSRATKDCVLWEMIDYGILYLNVDYQEKYLPETVDVYPESCGKSQTARHH